MPQSHTSRDFESELRELRANALAMGARCERGLRLALAAFWTGSSERAGEVKELDRRIDRDEMEIDALVLRILALRQPVAYDLRLLATALKLVTDLERIGDHAKHIGKRVVALDLDMHPQKLIRGVEHMATLVEALLKGVLDAYASHDVAAALAVWNGDEEVDAICTSLFRELLTYMMEDPRNITFCMHLMFCAKDIERIGDHATNIAETVYFMIEGRPITDQRPKGDTTSFGAALLQK